MSGNLNQSVRRTITNRLINEKFPQSAHTGKQKKKYYPGVFFKTAPKKRRFVHHYAFVCIIFVS